MGAQEFPWGSQPGASVLRPDPPPPPGSTSRLPGGFLPSWQLVSMKRALEKQECKLEVPRPSLSAHTPSLLAAIAQTLTAARSQERLSRLFCWWLSHRVTLGRDVQAGGIISVFEKHSVPQGKFEGLQQSFIPEGVGTGVRRSQVIKPQQQKSGFRSKHASEGRPNVLTAPGPSQSPPARTRVNY